MLDRTMSLVLPLSLLLACQDKSKKNELLEPTSLDQAQAIVNNLSPELKAVVDNAPTTYRFERDGQSTVDYLGQTFRQVLIEDLKVALSAYQAGSANSSVEDLKTVFQSYFNYTYNNSAIAPGVINGDSSYKLALKNAEGQNAIALEGTLYKNIQDPGKSLSEKIAGNDNRLLLPDWFGWQTPTLGDIVLASVNSDGKGDSFVEPEDFISAALETVAKRAVDGESLRIENGSEAAQLIAEAHITADGIDYSQLVQKFLTGAVSYSQALDDYLSISLGDTKGLNSKNTDAAKAGVTYTELEHSWDEGFGYFGGSRDLLTYTDQQLATNLSLDTNADGKISLLSEKAYGIAVTMGKRDVGGTQDWSHETMKLWLQGRQLITQKPEGYLPVVKAMAVLIAANWEKTLAATVIHYAKKTKAELGEYGTTAYSFKDHAKFWSEGKGFAMAFPYNPYSLLSRAEMEQIHTLLGDKPVLGTAGAENVAKAKADLDALVALLQEAFAFSEQQVSSW